ncbi:MULTISPECIES: DUF4032 domain-containing protein [Dictyoglomus]|jgi:uncharacterized ParB-like nuclease family protein|uniref:ParB domain protein nuclease n=1 Tax=Dictyoglomus turgidum (strain DSM 6724 / Z-1310) TaxID=515635 RepID=B8E0A2_DICTD|nr:MULTISPECIES: DUF4032 domain-containing protein [Dictyoglomus]ACK42547.1 ParB domain protein nuclease [Dictyoglomus turgidum DSM 6724]HBU32249.1 DUF4032 domain-containing protein [Dictyoglomus sp.]
MRFFRGLFKKRHLKSFDEKLKEEDFIGWRDLGYQTIEVDKIVGSVGRYRDFDEEFRPLKGSSKSRLQELENAILRGKILPPIEVYKIKDEYYVVDGNHRVAVAKKLGQKEIDAHIIEYIPAETSMENILARERSDFELITGLRDIILTEIGQYRKLLSQILEHKYYMSERRGEEVSIKEAARDWYKNIYLPIVEKIRKEKLLDAFPGRTESDLYVYISDHKWLESQKRGYDIGFDKAIEDFKNFVPETSLKEKIFDLFKFQF